MGRRKYLGRYDKDFIESIISQITRTDGTGLDGYAALIQIQKVKHPVFVEANSSKICIADDDYSELIFLPDNENWQLTAIYDNHGKIIEWYFDITSKNAVDEDGNPYCDDLYLDAALMPDGRVLILDEDQLTNALSSGSISQQDFDMAHGVMKRLIDDKIIDVAYLEELCAQLMGLF